MSQSSLQRFFVCMNALNDFAYFGFSIVQFLILENVLKTLLPTEFSTQSVGFAIAMIASQMVWQVLAEGPTGAYADVYGRAKAVAASFYCRVVAVAIVVGAAIFTREGMAAELRGFFATVIVLAQVFNATGEAALEGSVEAWLRDEMDFVTPSGSQQAVDKALGISAIAQNVATFTATAIFLSVWQISGGTAGTVLASVAGVVFFFGGVIATIASRRERFVQPPRTQETFSCRAMLYKAVSPVWITIRHAVVSLLESELPAVRRIIVVLVLPFPCWILLSWFYPAFVRRAGVRDDGVLPASVLAWFGIALGVSRVLGAWWGERITRTDGDRDVKKIFEGAVRANVTFLFTAATVLGVLSLFNVPGVIWAIVFVLLAAAAKASEEVVKLAKNRLLAILVADKSVRATILSLVSIAQDGFGFAALTLAGLLTVPVTSNSAEQPVAMFWTCGVLAVIGVALTALVRRNDGRS